MFSLYNCPYQINIINRETLYYPPTKNRAGNTKAPFDTKEIISIQTDLVKTPTIFTSDLHSHSYRVFEHLDSILDLSIYDIYTVGDMSGEMIYGSDGDSTPLYQMIKSKCNHLYVTQGNHDLPPSNISNLLQMENTDGSTCYLSDGEELVRTLNGTVGCVHGIIAHSDKKKPYRKYVDLYNALLQNILKKKPEFLFTHDTPALSYTKPDKKHVEFIGKNSIFDLIKKYKCKVHVYGHCHHPNVMTYIDQTLFINADARIIILNPL